MDNNYNNDQQNVTPDFNQAPQAPVDPYNGSAPTPDGPKGKAIASMVCGICAVVLGCCISGWLGLILGVIAIVLAVMVMKGNEAGRGMAVAGLVCGIVGALLGVVGIIIALFIGESLKEWAEALKDAGALFIK